MAAGVHAPGVRAGPGQASGLCHRQRVHVGAQADSAIGGSGGAAQRAHHPRAADAGRHLDAGLPQDGGHHASGALLLEAEFGMGVQIAPPFRHQRGEGGKILGLHHRGAACHDTLALTIRENGNALEGHPACLCA